MRSLSPQHAQVPTGISVSLSWLHGLAPDNNTSASAPFAKCPTTYIAAWMCCLQRAHFPRYVKLWEGMGHPTVSTMPTTRCIVLPGAGDEAATDFLGEVHAAHLQHPTLPVVYHIFR